jgi:hypothetical protein
MQDRKPNHLINEKSPYLLQHAYNPVDWYPWGKEAFAAAKKRDKPIFLSIGYSTCHWCHVMERESFEDEEVARLMNDTFVSIKVDREERPDIDAVYMEVCQAMSKSCGWPLNVIMTPDKRPLYVTTYLPKSSRMGLHGIVELTEQIRDAWKDYRKDLEEGADKIVKALSREEKGGRKLEMDSVALMMAYEHVLQMYDSKHGGFGTSPKFPTPHILAFLLRYWRRYNDANALAMVEKTLTEMRNGGIFDMLGFGFHRYSTDSQWLVPHFEKMLYDQALISLAYTEAYQATRNPLYKDTLEKIFGFVERELTAPNGAFYSAIDADSEGVEGKFYVWKEEEVEAALTGNDLIIAKNAFDIQRNGNYVDRSDGTMGGRNILHAVKPAPGEMKKAGIKGRDAAKELEKIREILFKEREKRVHPPKDEKILVDWNGLMIAALSRASTALGDKRLMIAAKSAADFILDTLVDRGRMMHLYNKGVSNVPGMLDDYAFMIFGLIELYEASFDIKYLKAAMELNASLIAHFWDKDRSGFYMQPDDSERLFIRKKTARDGAIPSGNSIEMLNLLRLIHLTGNTKLLDYVHGIESAFHDEATSAPAGFAQLMVALDYRLGPSYEIVIAQGSEEEKASHMLNAINTRFIPNKVLILKRNDVASGVEDMAPYTVGLDAREGKATAYVCSDQACRLPTGDEEEMLKELGAEA